MNNKSLEQLAKLIRYYILVATTSAQSGHTTSALSASDELKKQDVAARVIDCYSIKPIDTETLKIAARETRIIITVEDHYAVGGLGEAVRTVMADTKARIVSLAVTKMPQSGSPTEHLAYEGIAADTIVQTVLQLL
ncbi:hypothetical protein HY409_00990 [Candidatus Gottesmanbacteria bacterium]|nr:hypothetical protein [Candidatus Gottesmanbacteria bacterium]